MSFEGNLGELNQKFQLKNPPLPQFDSRTLEQLARNSVRAQFGDLVPAELTSETQKALLRIRYGLILGEITLKEAKVPSESSQEALRAWMSSQRTLPRDVMSLLQRRKTTGTQTEALACLQELHAFFKSVPNLDDTQKRQLTQDLLELPGRTTSARVGSFDRGPTSTLKIPDLGSAFIRIPRWNSQRW